MHRSVPRPRARVRKKRVAAPRPPLQHARGQKKAAGEVTPVKNAGWDLKKKSRGRSIFISPSKTGGRVAGVVGRAGEGGKKGSGGAIHEKNRGEEDPCVWKFGERAPRSYF